MRRTHPQRTRRKRIVSGDEWEPNWCASCSNIAVTRPGAVCDICINEEDNSE